MIETLKSGLQVHDPTKITVKYRGHIIIKLICEITDSKIA